jgi:small redox-active disulfide protein 2
MQIKVLGTGCANCKKTKAVAAEAVAELDIDAQIIEVTDIADIMGYGVMTTPGIVIDEKVVGSGGVPTKEQMKQLLQGAM